MCGGRTEGQSGVWKLINVCYMIMTWWYLKGLYDLINFRLFIAATHSNIGEFWYVLHVFISMMFVTN